MQSTIYDSFYEAAEKYIKCNKFEDMEILMTELKKLKNYYEDPHDYHNTCHGIAHLCVNEKRHDMFEMILRYIDVNYKDTYIDTFIFEIISYYNKYIRNNEYQINEKIIQVLNYTNDVNETDNEGYTILERYFYTFFCPITDLSYYNYDIIKTILEKGATINFINDGFAIYNLLVPWCCDIVELLFEHATKNGEIIDFPSLLSSELMKKTIYYDVIELLLRYLNIADITDNYREQIKNIVSQNNISIETDVIELLELHNLY